MPPITPIDQVPGSQAIPGVGEADWVEVVDGQAWVAGVRNGLGRFDKTGKLIGTVTLPGGVCLAMDAAFESLWVANCDTPSVIRIDPKTAIVSARIKLDVAELAAESSIGAGEGGVWLLSGGSHPRLIRVDPTTNATNTSLDPPQGANAVRAGLGALWVPCADGRVRRLDPKTGRVVAEIEVEGEPRFLAIGGGSVWVLNQRSGSVSRIDPTTNTVVATILVDPLGVEGGDMAFGGGSAWARVSSALVARIDPATNRVTQRIGQRSGSGSVDADDTAVWISAHDVGTIWRVPLG